VASITRRQFIRRGGTGITAASLYMARPASGIVGANERIVVGVIGCGGMGKGHCRTLADLPEAKVAYVCDPDSTRCNEAKLLTGSDRAVGDLRRILDDKGVDAVVVATPDHWHAPATVLACEAGKHVYVEKPCSHNFREGQWMVRAARRTNRVVQHGTQSRSDEFILGAIRKLQEGVIGDVLVAKAWNIQRRKSIGRGTPEDPPAGVEYDLWVGPAPYVPFQVNRFHYNWRWWYHFGTGDMGNDGAHEIDMARWGLGVRTLPSTVSAAGGKYFFDDDQEFPDTLTAAFEYPGDGKVAGKRMLIYEQRIWSTNSPLGIDNGVEFFGSKGRMLLSKRGRMEIFDDRNRPIASQSQAPTKHLAHLKNFFDAIKSGRRPNADIEIGFLSVALSHLGNIAARLGRSPRFDPEKARFVDDEEANRLLTRSYRPGHWAVPKGV